MVPARLFDGTVSGRSRMLGAQKMEHVGIKARRFALFSAVRVCGAGAHLVLRSRMLAHGLRTGHIAVWRCLARVRLAASASLVLSLSLPPRSSPLACTLLRLSMSRLALARLTQCLPAFASADPNVPCSRVVSRR